MVKNMLANAGDAENVGLIPGSGRCPGVENSNSSQYSSLGNPWTEEPGGPWGHRVRHDLVTKQQQASGFCPLFSESSAYRMRS